MMRLAWLTLAACSAAADAPRLVAITDDPPSAACPRGGTTITAGLDDNRNGTLEPGEVEVSEQQCRDPIIHGDLVIENALDVDAARGITEIEGSLIIARVAPGDLSSLIRIRGSLVADDVAGVIAAPSLIEVGGSVDLEATGVELPALASIGFALRLDLTGEPTTVTLPALTALRNNLALHGNLAFSAPHLERANALVAVPRVDEPDDGRVGVTAIDLPALTTLTGGLDLERTQLTTLSLPALTSASSLTVVDNAQLCTSVVTALQARTGITGWVSYNKDC